jgi:ATP-dependent DNA helicase UvrD/PcrA
MTLADRQHFVDAIVGSAAPRKLVVAGPGTGKTTVFQQLLAKSTGPKLAITFINSLVEELKARLGDGCEVLTFHKFCRRLLHKHAAPGISNGVDYYPPALRIFAEDRTAVDGEPTLVEAIESALHNLEEGDILVGAALRSGDYYDAVGHTDAVYRMLRRLVADPALVPQYAQIVVDEFQDFSRLEARFIAVLGEGSPILVAGDDDQALYGFKHASANFLRELAEDNSFTRFELPYCSRCTSVLVEAVHRVVAGARAAGLLAGRLEKKYICYMPDKAGDSERYPRVLHARCSVERNGAPYMARYIRHQISRIAPEEIQESRREGYPTVLVVGPSQFSDRVYQYLSQHFGDVVQKRSSVPEIRLLDGYRRLATDPRSRLGWRIILYRDPAPDQQDLLRRALLEGAELSDLLPAAIREPHLQHAETVASLLRGDAAAPGAVAVLETALGISLPEIRKELELDVEDAAAEPLEGGESDSPGVMVTTLVGAKGLQASHVFVVGVNAGHLPRRNEQPTDEEVCKFLVALTRARKSCTILSCNRFGNARLGQSAFVQWVQALIQEIRVDSTWLHQNGVA